MAMEVTVEVGIPNCAEATVTLTNTPPATEWIATQVAITRTCPVSGDVHVMRLDISYVPNLAGPLNAATDWGLDTLFVSFGTPEVGIATFGPTLFTTLLNSSVDVGAGTQTRLVTITLPAVIELGQTGTDGVTTPNRLQGGLFAVNALGMPIPILRAFRLVNAFHYTLPAANTIVNVYEDAGGGVAGARYGSVTTNAAGECSLTSETPLRDFVLRIGGQDYPLAAGSTPAVVTTNSTDKTDAVVALLAGAYAPAVAPIAVT